MLPPAVCIQLVMRSSCSQCTSTTHLAAAVGRLCCRLQSEFDWKCGQGAASAQAQLTWPLLWGASTAACSTKEGAAADVTPAPASAARQKRRKVAAAEKLPVRAARRVHHFVSQSKLDTSRCCMTCVATQTRLRRAGGVHPQPSPLGRSPDVLNKHATFHARLIFLCV